MQPMSLARLAALHKDDALNAAWEAFLAERPMSWLVQS